MSIAAIKRRMGLDQIAGEQDLLLGQPDDGVALCMAAPGVDDAHFAFAEP